MSPVDFPANRQFNFDHRYSRLGKRTIDDCDHSMSSEINGGFGYDDSRHRKCSRLSPRLELQFFVKMMSTAKTLVFQSNLEDRIEQLHMKIQVITGIPVSEQRLIYEGKQLSCEQTMAECGVQNDAVLQLVGRMRSTGHSKAWRVISELVNLVSQVCRNSLSIVDCKMVKAKLDHFLAMPLDRDGLTSELCENSEYYKIFMDAYVPQALVVMYRSKEKKTQECADECIRTVISLGGKDSGEGESDCAYSAMMLLEFRRLFKASRVHLDDKLYLHCQSALGMKLGIVKVEYRKEAENDVVKGDFPFLAFQDVFPIFEEVGHRLLTGLMKCVGSSSSSAPELRDVRDFAAFLKPVLSVIQKECDAQCIKEIYGGEGDAQLIEKSHGKGKGKGKGKVKGKGKCKGKVSFLGDEVNSLFCLFIDMLNWIGKCMDKIESYLCMARKIGIKDHPTSWSHYLAIFKELRNIAVIYPGFEDQIWTVMRKNKLAVSALIVHYSTHDDDHTWLLKLKDVLDFEARRHLALLMFPKVDEDYDEAHEMLIDRSQLLAESFEYIHSADKYSLQGALFMEFKNETATGPGVLREWFYLVSQAFFDPQKALFVACPLDRRRFYPNPASKVNPLHMQYFGFAGRVIALALMHRIQIGGVLDRVFFSQLAGRCVSLEDIKDADPCVYNSCKQILEMDPEFVDSDGLGLTFVTEVEELGSMEVVELCSGGKNIVVNSKNREEYVQLLIEQHFVTSIEEQVSSFAQGFADILSDDKLRITFFESLELEDLDWMLHGSGSEEISVEDWEAHTVYEGYKKSDPLIVWFWKVVGQLNAEQKRTLLFFWTSVKYLPIEGFRGLGSKLFITKSLEPPDRLPSSHTCYYQLCIPQYPSKTIVQDRLRVITQEHVGCSFGTV